MKTIEHFLTKLASKGIRLEQVGKRLTAHAPKGAMTPELAESIRERKAEILTFLTLYSDARSPIEKAPPNQTPPMSFSQQRLWFLNELAGSANQAVNHYNMCSILEIHGNPDCLALEAALHRITKRHENLRTNFQQRDGMPVQIIRNSLAVPIHFCDITGLKEDVSEAIVRAEMGYAFDLAHEPLFRLSLLHLGKNHFQLLLNMHHIISDAWSMKIFVHELVAFYMEIIQGTPAQLPPLDLQYSDFSFWQQQEEQLARIAKQTDWWRETLAHLEPVHQLPLDRPRPKTATFCGKTYRHEVTGTVAEDLQRVSQETGSTVFMVLLAAFQVLIYRFSQQTDIVVGTPVANRNQLEIEPLIGFFVNTLVLRVTVDPNASFNDFLKQVRQVALQAYAHQDLPFEQVVDALKPERHLNHTPLFQLMFAYNSVNEPSLDIPGLELSAPCLENDIAKFDLTLDTQPTDAGLLTSWEYNRDLFDHATIVSMADYFDQLLSVLLRHPNRELAKTTVIDDAKTKAHFAKLNQTACDYALVSAVHVHFEKHAARQPDHKALMLSSDDAFITYGELNRRANQWAWHLLDKGVQPETRIALLAPSSPELVIGLLAIFKTGAIAVPLDPKAPAERLAYMLKDSRVALALSYACDVQTLKKIPVLKLEDEVVKTQRSDNPNRQIQIDQVAFLIYTSGSTGMPKASMNTHRGLLNHHLWMQASAPMKPTDRIVNKTTIGFDAAIWECMLPLTHGAQLVLGKPGMEGDPFELRKVLETCDVTHIFFVPSVLRALLDHIGYEKLTCKLRYIFCGGEVVLPQDHRRVLETIENPGEPVRFYDIYGPSECAITSISFYCGQEPQPSPPPIGEPHGNMQAFITDSRMTLAPLGMPGELVLAGPGLSRGYYGKPGLTASKFVPNPFETNQTGSRLYRTGDLARLKPDGQLYFVSRIDHQVKLRGMRIEMGEIEACLAEHSAITKVAVVVHHSEKSGQRLVGYLETEAPEPTVLIAELKEKLSQKLPAYMVPRNLIPLERMPQLPSGKIARVELARRPIAHLGHVAGYRAPKTQLEKALAAIWCEVLDLKDVGVEDNFFEVGGHSLLATQVVSRIQADLHLKLPLQQIFTQPTIHGLAAWIENADMATPFEAISPRTRDEAPLPLSFAQQRLWFIDQLTRQKGVSTGTYNIYMAFKIRGALKLDALQQALTRLEQRHEILRTNFQEMDGKPVQVIRDEPTLEVCQHERDGMAEDEVLEEIHALCQKGFSLSDEPLLRLDVLHRSKSDHLLVLNMHHIISDGWSMSILVRELIGLYFEALGLPSKPLAPLKLQYADFSTWQRRPDVSAELERQAAWWQKRLAHLPVVHQIPTDRPRPRLRTENGATLKHKVSTTTQAELKALAGDSGATLFMVLLAAFQVLLAKYSGQRDIAVGTPIANRNREEIEPLIGFFVNTLVLRAQVEPAMSFSDLLRQVTQTTLESYDHQDIPFEKIVDLLQPQRHTSHSPLFQIVFSLQNVAAMNVSLPNFELEPLEVESGTAKVDLHLDAILGEDGLVTAWQYNTDLFDAGTIEAMARHFAHLLQALVGNPERPLAQIEFLDEALRTTLIQDWGSCPWPVTINQPVHAYMEDHAESLPDRIALVTDDASSDLSYAALNARANSLAWGLLRAGAKPEMRVALIARSSSELIVGFLAILKAGCVVAPMDPNTPPARLAHMLTDSDAGIVLIQSHGLVDVPHPQVYALDGGEIYSHHEHNLNLEIHPDRAAFLIYTSGSTGMPKASINTHRGLANHHLWVQSQAPMDCDDRLLYKTPINFDAAMWEGLYSLMVGAQVVVAPPGSEGDPAVIRRLIADHRVTHLVFVPSLLRAFLDHLGEAVFLSQLRQIVTGGEKLLPQDHQRVLRHLKGAPVPVQLRNHYGPSETTISVTHFPCGNTPLQDTIPIGQPNGNSQVLVVDRQLNLVPPGMPGDLVIGGAGLSRCYQGRPALTACKYVPHPYAMDRPGERLYLTGDLARLRHDGKILFLGRADHQIKLRGMRIELGEIEAHLNEHEDVSQAVVIMVTAQHGEQVLTAMVRTAHENPPELIQDLRIFLRDKLPDYMVPASIIPLETWPLLSTGKVDVHRLKTWAANHHSQALEQAYVAPRNEIETALCDIWQDVLKLEQVGIEDNFFEIGGHSLLATQVISRIRKQLDVDMPLQTLFEAPKVISLAERISSAERSHEARIPLAHRDRFLPLSFAQERLWFLHRLEGANAAYNMPFALRLDGPLNRDALAQALGAICERHEVLRVAFFERAGRAHMRFRQPRPFSLALVEVTEVDLPNRAAAEAAKVFDLEKDPLFRATLLRLEPERHLLMLTLHHIIADGWSFGILFEELATFYQSFLAKSSPPLPALPIQYGDFAVWQRDWLKDEVLDSQLAFWKRQLQDAPTLLELPTDRPRPRQQTFHGDNLPFVLEAPLSKQLSELASKQGATLFMVLEAAFALLLSRYSGSTDILIGTPVANRTRAETEKLIGLFVNTLVIRNDLSDNPNFNNFLQRVRQSALDAYNHQDVPFEKVIDAVNPERSLGFSPLFQVMMVFQNLPASKRVAHDLAISQLESERRTAKFDLMLTMNETGDVIAGNFEYNTDLFDRATIELKISHFQTLLRAIVEQPARALAEFSLFESDPVKKELAGPSAKPFKFCVHHLIEQQAAMTPGATALIDQDGRPWSYAQLNRRANALAQALTAAGVMPYTLVGVLMPRNLDMVAAMLAIHKCGAAYVPLDPAYPEERLRFMRNDAGISALISNSPNPYSKFPVIDPGKISDGLAENPRVTLFANHLSHLIYTSGSTGKPKGVAIRHRATAALINWAESTFDDHQFGGMLAATSISFDLSVFEIFAPLTRGGTVILAENALALASHPARDRVRLVNTVPSAIAELAHNDAIPSSVHTIALAGEPLRGDLVKQLYSADHVQRIYNLYGPSEDTTYSTGTLISCTSKAEPSIGKPLHGTSAIVLGPHLESLPSQAPGMLYLAGAGLARGYLGQPAKTAEAFIPHPFALGKRLYRTGDRVRLQRDGDLFFIGRKDHQVKLRGFRIELGEIETALQADPHVSGAHLQVLDNQLAAFLQATQPELQQHLEITLKTRLPTHMVPTRWYFLEHFPLLPNGKVDRKALVKMAEETESQLEETLTPPENDAEEKLLEVWREVLPHRSFGVTDNFFNIGGDSILSLRIIARARHFGLHFTAKDLFEFPTIRQLTTAVTHAGQVVIDAEQGLVSGAVPLTPNQTWFLDLDWHSPGHFNQARLFSLSHELDLNRLKTALEAVIHHHDALRLRFKSDGQTWHQTHGEPYALDFQVIDLSNSHSAEAELEQHADVFQASVDLDGRPLMRAAVFKGLHETTPGRSFRLLLIAHHLIVDSNSWTILQEDLNQAYAFPQMPLPEKTTSFKAWSQRLADLPVAPGEDQWWRKAVTRGGQGIPCDFARDENAPKHHVASLHHKLDAENTRALLGKVHQPYRTSMDDLLLTALMESVHQSFGNTSLWIDLQSHGREHRFEDVDLSRTVGWFTTRYPVRLEKGTENHVATSLKRIKEMRRTLPNQGLGFGLLKHLHGALESAPPAEVLFHFSDESSEWIQDDSLCGVATETIGLQRPDDPSTHILELHAVIRGEQLHLSWTYATKLFMAETIERLAMNYTTRLEALIDHCLSEEAGGFTPSDFPLAKLEATTLDRFTADKPDIVDLYPLSPMQEGMLFHTLAQPQGGNYFEQLVFDLEGDFQADVFAKSWQHAVSRHAILRTSFHWAGLERPLQCVHNQAALPIQIMDLRCVAPDRQAGVLTEIRATERVSGFNLQLAPVMRLLLVRLAQNQWHIVCNYHHMLLDGWAATLLFREVMAGYAFALQKETPHFPEIQPYRNYIAWLESRHAGEANTYWQQALSGFQKATPLPFSQTFAGNQPRELAAVERHLSQQQQAHLNELTSTWGVTTNTLLQAAWSLVLAAHSGWDDVLFGTIVSGRPTELEGVESIVGLFINALPVRVQLRDEPLKTWIKTLQDAQVTRETFSFTPLVEAQAHSQVPRNEPLFESLLVFENAAPGTSPLPSGLNTRIHGTKNIEQTHFPMVLIAVPGERLHLKLGFDTRRFSQVHMATLMDQVVHLLDSIDLESEFLPKKFLAKTLPDTRGGTSSNLTENQMLIWMGQALDPNDHSYHNLTTFRLNGELNPDDFCAAFESVVMASDALRTVYTHHTGTPQREILEKVPCKPELHDFSKQVDPEKAYAAWLNQTKTHILDLEKSAYRTALCKLASNRSIWFLKIHQLAADGEALSALYHQVQQAYQQRQATGGAETLSLPQYEAFIANEASYQNARQHTRDLAFWRNKLADEVEALSFYGSPPSRKDGVITSHHHFLELDQLSRLDSWLSTELGGEPSHNGRLNFFLTTLVIYLSKVSGRQTVTIGIPIHNRRGKPFKRTIGSFMHVLPLRVTLAEGDTVASLMAKISKLSFEALRYGRAALANSKQNPVYDVILNYHLSRFPDFAGIPMDFDWVHPGSGHLAMTLQVSDFEVQDRLKLTFELHEPTFPTENQTRVMSHYLNVFDACLAASHPLIQKISLATPLEKRALEAFNPVIKPWGPEVDILQPIAEAAGKLPERTAVVSYSERMTYRELSQQSDALAQSLLARGIGFEDRIGICLSKDLDLPVAILAVLKAGATYIPLDPTYPKDRLEYIVTDSEASLILTKQKFHSLFPDRSCLFLDEPWEKAISVELPEIFADQAAYIVYTSGSTGRPKGVVACHRGWYNLFRAYEQEYTLDFGATTHLQMASFSFDLFAADFIRALGSGGTLVLVEKNQLLDPETLYSLMMEHRVTHSEFVPAVLRPFADYLEQHQLDLPYLKVLPAGSDAWFTGEYVRFRKLLRPETRLINAYGVTEATIDNTHFESDPADLKADRTVPIGAPFANIHLLALDHALEFPPVGVPGELFIGGECVARGYWKNPALTAERFMPNPLGHGSRFYRTGDAVRHLPGSMAMEFLGRMDQQVKIRGFRVEPGEIEAVLGGLLGVQIAVVMVRELDAVGDKLLVAHILPEDPQNLEPEWLESLREQARAQLPEHMVPAHFDPVATMPMTPNGKLDRKALAQRPLVGLSNDSATDPPRNDVEATMVSLWEKVLDRSPIGIHANFFDLGGHSLLAVRLLAQCREHFERPLQLHELFNEPTPARLAALLTSGSHVAAYAVPIQPNGTKPPLFLVHAVDGGVAGYKPMADLASKQRPIFAIQANFDQPETDLKAMATQYIELIRNITPEGPYLLGGWSIGGTIAFEMARQLQAMGESIACLMLIDSLPFDQLQFDGEYDEAEILVSYVNHLTQDLQGISIEAPELRKLEEAQRLSLVLAQAKRAGVLPESIALEQVQAQWHMFKTNAQANQLFRPQPIRGALHLLRAEERDARLVDLADNGWGHLADEVIIHHQPGNHMTMLAQPHVQTVVHAFETIMEDQP